MNAAQSDPKQLVSAVSSFVDRKLDTRLASLEARLAKLEAELAAKCYLGVWRPQISYKRHNQCTHRGGLWIALRDTCAKPGADDSWRLAVKSGDAG